MDTDPKVGFASVKVLAKSGKITSEPTYHHKFPIGETADTINVNKLEKELLSMAKHHVSKHSPTEYEAKFGYFIEYTKEQYSK